MSNYMSSANQTILWNTVNRIPAFIQLSPPKRDLEFKRITEYFYRENANKSILSIDELRELNRKTVLAFLPSASLVSREKPPLHPSIPVSESNMVETRQEKQERAFLERQNMYAQMTEKPNLPSPDMFKEKEPDAKITNMDELIENYQKQRNLEIPVLPPIIPSIMSSSSTVPSSVPLAPSVPSENRKKNITFLEGNIELNSLEIQDLSIDSGERKNLALNDSVERKNLALNDSVERKNLALNDSVERKNLAWNINLEETRVIEDSYLQELEKRIVSLEKQIQFLSEIRKETQEKEIQTISISESELEPNPNPEVEDERKEIEEIIESAILSIEQQNE